jgi:isoamylase
MTEQDWKCEDAPALAVFLNGREIPDQRPDGQDLHGHSFLLLINAHHQPLPFTLPTPSRGVGWVTEISTADPTSQNETPRSAGDSLDLESRSILILRRV